MPPRTSSTTIAASADPVSSTASTASPSSWAIAADATSLSGWAAVLASPHVLLGVGLWVLSTVLYILVLSRTELSYAYCLGSLNYVAVPLISRALFGDPISTGHCAGILLIAAGVGLTMLSRVAP